MLASSVCVNLSDETNDWNGDGQTLNMLLHQSGPHWKKLPETKFSFMGNGLYSYSIGIFQVRAFNVRVERWQLKSRWTLNLTINPSCPFSSPIQADL
jgi:hypothetical protein